MQIYGLIFVPLRYPAMVITYEGRMIYNGKYRYIDQPFKINNIHNVQDSLQ